MMTEIDARETANQLACMLSTLFVAAVIVNYLWERVPGLDIGVAPERHESPRTYRR